MKVLQLGAGAVGTVIARHLAGHPAIEAVTIADLNGERAAEVARSLPGSASSVPVDASDAAALARAAAGHAIIVSSVLPRYNVGIMRVALSVGAHLLDLSAERDDHELYDADWKRAGLTAIHGLGEDPGISNLFARWAADRLDRVDAIRIRDGEFYEPHSELPLASLFSTETFIADALAPASFYSAGEWQRVPAWSGREVYDFPPPVGKQVVYAMDHEEVDTLPRYLGKPVGAVDFKLAVPDRIREQIVLLDRLGMTRRDRVQVCGGDVAPLAVLAAVLPRPFDLGGRIRGASIILVDVEGSRDGRRVRTTLHASMTHEEAFVRMQVTGTAYLTGSGAAAGVLALATGGVAAHGVLLPEMLDPDRLLSLLAGLGVGVTRRSTDV